MLRVRKPQRAMKNYILGFIFISAAVSFVNCTTPVSDTLKKGLNTSQGNPEDTTAVITIEDFFLPQAPNNKVIFSTPGSSMKMSRHYILNDSLVIIKDSTFVEGNYQSGEIKTIQFIDNEVHLIRSESFFGKWSPKIMDYNPSQIILKLPADDDSEIWTSTDPDKGLISYSASWVEIEKDKQKLTFLRVEKSYEYTKVKEVDYNSSESGLTKSEMLTTGGASIAKLQLEGLSEVPGL